MAVIEISGLRALTSVLIFISGLFHVAECACAHPGACYESGIGIWEERGTAGCGLRGVRAHCPLHSAQCQGTHANAKRKLNLADQGAVCEGGIGGSWGLGLGCFRALDVDYDCFSV